jgi:hypothetical protein
MAEKNLAQVLREQMRSNGKRFWAGDNVSEFVDEDKKQQLIDEATVAFENVLDTLLIDRENDPNSKGRANIYLENYKMGQFIQYELDGKFETSTNWKAGDGFLWDSNILHVSSNAGFQDKYTLQVSGFALS